jgi:hypothetical protein
MGRGAFHSQGATRRPCGSRQPPADGAEGVRQALRSAGIQVLENDALRVAKDGQPFWVAGLADQIGDPTGNWRFKGLDDLGGTLA